MDRRLLAHILNSHSGRHVVGGDTVWCLEGYSQQVAACKAALLGAVCSDARPFVHYDESPDGVSGLSGCSAATLSRRVGLGPAPSFRDHSASLAGMEYAKHLSSLRKEHHLAKPNYAFAKRQRDLAKKQKNQAKRERKAESGQPAPATTPEQSPPGEKSVP